jgi:signal transduction histidine kinase
MLFGCDRKDMNARVRHGLLLAAAVTAPVAVAVALTPLRGHISNANVALLMVVAVAPVAFGGRAAGTAAGISAALAFDFFWTPPVYELGTWYGQDLVGTAVYLAVGLVVSELASQNRRQRTRAEELASEQAALRRVATLVAKGVPEGNVFAAVAEQVGRLADASTAQIFRYEPDGSIVRLAAWGSGAEDLQIGARYPTGGHDVATMVLHSGQRARIDDTGGGPGRPAPLAGQPDSGSVVGDPIVMDGRVWGLVMVTASGPGTLTGDAEQRIAGFTELVATAVSNVQRRTDLVASRRRVVAAGDQMRRRIERNLHDGVQQQLVTLALELRGARGGIPSELPQARAELARVEEGLANVLSELREISRGVHPAILSEGGIGPAVKSLARRAALSVNLDVQVAERLPQAVEVAAYYVVSESLANAAKYASASTAEVEVKIDNGALRVHVRDDGTRGADPAKGSGIVGLRDRVEALGGSMVLASPPGEGTSMLAEFPLGILGGDRFGGRAEFAGPP